MSEHVTYNVEVSGIGFQNKNGEERKDIVRNFLGSDDYERNVTAYLKREKGNRSDKNAIAVYLHKKGFWYEDEGKIGYIPRESAKDIAPQLEDGGEIKNIKITRVWIPDSPRAKPYVHLSFDTSWTEADIVRKREEKKLKDKEYRAKLKQRKIEAEQKRERDKKESLFIIPLFLFLLMVYIFHKCLNQ